MILSAQTIRSYCKSGAMVEPFVERTTSPYAMGTMTYGLSPAGYDIRVAEMTIVGPGGFMLASSLEQFTMPLDVLARVTDKSSWARQGLCVQNTVIEPGWRGFLTLELTNHGYKAIRVEAGAPIAQVLFELLDKPTDQPYEGKYQDQESGPQVAR